MKPKAETSQGPLGSPKAGRGKRDPPLEPPEGAWPCPHLDFQPLPSRAGRAYILWCKPPSLWRCVRATPGQEHTGRAGEPGAHL